MRITILYKGNKESCKVIKETLTHYYVITDDEDKLKLPKDSSIIVNTKKEETDMKLTIPMLEKKIRKAKVAYYNDTPIMTDAEFDSLEDQLRELDHDNKLLLEIGAEVEKNKAELPFYMPSLNKMKPDTASKWLEKNEGPYCLSDKIDGISVQLVSNKGHWNLYTRGDGSTGQDISYIEKYLRIPTAPSKLLAIRAELVLTIADFEAINETLDKDKKAANARNFVGGLLNSTKNLNVAHIKKVDVIAYEVINIPMKPSEQFEYLEKLGFKTANWKKLNRLSRDILIEFLINRKKKAHIEMDGLVVSLDKVNKRTTSGNPSYSISFKMLTEDQTAVVKVIRVEWEPSKHGLLKPVVIIGPLED
jgi:DNA ligase (NAD+)